MWLTDFKIAIVEENVEKLDELMKNLPKFEHLQEKEEAYYLIQEASALVTALQDKTAHSMKQIKKSLDFLKSTHLKASSKLDIKS